MSELFLTMVLNNSQKKIMHLKNYLLQFQHLCLKRLYDTDQQSISQIFFQLTVFTSAIVSFGV